ncbi:MAG: aminomethyl transferase family protein [Armatimonadetes bacterium]|nr:aminomethyl transferase family protein [Armatimonadota bacterium]
MESPEHFGNPEREYAALRETLGLLDCSFRGTLELEGKDRVSFLHGLVTQDIKGLKSGNCAYSLMTTNKARIMADMFVYALPDSLILDLVRQNVDKVKGELEKYIFVEDVTVKDVSHECRHFSLLGPAASAVLKRRPGALPEEEGKFELHTFGGETVLVGRTSYGQVPRFDLFVPTRSGESLWTLLVAESRTLGGIPVGTTALEMLRIEEGIPLYGMDFDETVMPAEAGLEHAVSFTKGCYVGQEPIARLKHRGHVNKLLCGVKADRDTPIPPDTAIFAGEREIGRVTSAARSPLLKCAIALAYVRVAEGPPNTEIRLGLKGEEGDGTVVSLPFVHLPKAP